MNQIEILKAKEVLTADEYVIVAKAAPIWAKEFLFRNDWNGTYLNLDAYSEVEKEQRDLQMERGF